MAYDPITSLNIYFTPDDVADKLDAHAVQGPAS